MFNLIIFINSIGIHTMGGQQLDAGGQALLGGLKMVFDMGFAVQHECLSFLDLIAVMQNRNQKTLFPLFFGHGMSSDIFRPSQGNGFEQRPPAQSSHRWPQWYEILRIVWVSR
jgi:hypothetical protein